MPVERFVQSVAAGVVTPNLLEDSTYKYLPQPHSVIVYCVADADGIDLELMFGNVVDTRAYRVPVRAATVGPNRSDDLGPSGVGMGGDLVSVRLRNTTAGAIPVRTLVEFRPV
jgi:hypothetical protein